MVERLDADAPERGAAGRRSEDLIEIVPKRRRTIWRRRCGDWSGFRDAGAEQEQRGQWQQRAASEGAAGLATRRLAFT